MSRARSGSSVAKAAGPAEPEPWTGGDSARKAERATRAGGAEAHASGVGSHAPVIFDRSALLTWYIDVEGIASTVASVFLAHMPVQIGRLASAIEAGDCRKTHYHARLIKGVSADVGGELLCEAAYEMERAAKAGDLAALRALLPRVEMRFAQVKEAMEPEFGTGRTVDRRSEVTGQNDTPTSGTNSGS